jgi:hypothetical protein
MAGLFQSILNSNLMCSRSQTPVASGHKRSCVDGTCAVAPIYCKKNMKEYKKFWDEHEKHTQCGSTDSKRKSFAGIFNSDRR